MISTSLRLEFFKVKHRPGWLVLAVFLAFLLKGSVFMAAKFGAFGGIQNGFAFMGVSALYSVFLASFLLCIIASTSLSGEYVNGLLRMQLARPVSRSSYFFSRTFFLTVIAFLLITLDGLVGAFVGWMGHGFSNVADPNLQGVQFSLHAMAWTTLKCYWITFIGLAGLASLGLMISVLFRMPIVSIGVTVGSFFFMEGIRVLFREPAASYVLTYYTHIHLNHLSKLARGIAEYQAPGLFMKAVAVPMVYFLITQGVGWFFFKRLDVLD